MRPFLQSVTQPVEQKKKQKIGTEIKGASYSKTDLKEDVELERKNIVLIVIKVDFSEGQGSCSGTRCRLLRFEALAGARCSEDRK